MSFFNFFRKSKKALPNLEKGSSTLDFTISSSIYLYNRERLKEYIKKNLQEVHINLLEMDTIDLLSIDDADIQLGSFDKDRDDILNKRLPLRKKNIAVIPEPEKTKEIINRLRVGDGDVYNYLFDNEFSKIDYFINLNSGNRENASDLFQESLLIILEKIYNNTLEIRHSFSTYFFSIARNLWINEIRKSKKQITIIDEQKYLDLSNSSFEIENFPDNYDDVCKAIESLGDSCRKLLEYYYFRNMAWKDIAEIMGYSSPGSARNQKFKCLEQIRKSIIIEYQA